MAALAKRFVPTPRKGILPAILAGVGWLAFDPCYCWWSFDFSSHLTSVPSGCAVLPELKWSIPSNRQTGEIFVFDVRLSAFQKDEVVIALRSRGQQEFNRVTPRIVKEKYAFRFRALDDGESSGIENLRRVSDEDWEKSAPLQIVHRDQTEDQDLIITPEATVGSVDESPLSYDHQFFKKTDQYWFLPALVSAGRRRIALFSFGRARFGGNAVFSWGDLFSPWRTFAVDIYDVSDGHHSVIREWSCGSGGAFGAAWYGDRLFVMPEGKRAAVLCGFK